MPFRHMAGTPGFLIHGFLIHGFFNTLLLAAGEGRGGEAGQPATMY
jgi:hypothetical protein